MYQFPVKPSAPTQIQELTLGSLNICGCALLFGTSFPKMDDSIKIAGLALGMIFLGLGTGGIRATMTPFIGINLY